MKPFRLPSLSRWVHLTRCGPSIGIPVVLCACATSVSGRDSAVPGQVSALDTGTRASSWTPPQVSGQDCSATIAIDDGEDGIVDRVQMEVYGNGVLGQTTWAAEYNDPNAWKMTAEEWWTYDAGGFVIDYRYAYYSTLAHTSFSESWVRTGSGAVLEHAQDYSGNGTPDWVQTFVRDDAERALSATIDADGDGSPEEQWTYSYAADWLPSLIEVDVSLDGTVDWVSWYEMPSSPDADYSYYEDQDLDGVPDYIERVEYLPGTELWTSLWVDEDGDGSVDVEAWTTWSGEDILTQEVHYHARDLGIRYEVTYLAPGVLKDYRREEDTGLDGTTDAHSLYTVHYFCDGTDGPG